MQLIAFCFLRLSNLWDLSNATNNLSICLIWLLVVCTLFARFQMYPKQWVKGSLKSKSARIRIFLLLVVGFALCSFIHSLNCCLRLACIWLRQVPAKCEGLNPKWSSKSKDRILYNKQRVFALLLTNKLTSSVNLQAKQRLFTWHDVQRNNLQFSDDAFI